MDSDNPISSPKDIDAPLFREQSLPRVQETLKYKLVEVKDVLQSKDKDRLKAFVSAAADDINRTIVDAGSQEDIYSTPDTAIVHSFGMTLWRKPEDINALEEKIADSLTSKLIEGQMDIDRFGKGLYFKEVLLHKYKNGNGRVARGMKLLVDKSSNDSTITEEDTSKMLGIGREGVSQTGEHTYRINVDPDFERLVLGVAYFGLEKGLTEEQVVKELKLNGSLPENGLQAVANKLGVPQEQIKNEFVHFMVVDSNLEWCNFGTGSLTS